MKPGAQIFTQEDKAKLVELMPTHNRTQLANQFGRTLSAIDWQLHKIRKGITNRQESKKWKTWELKLMKQFYGQVPTEHLAIFLIDRTPQAIRYKMHQLRNPRKTTTKPQWQKQAEKANPVLLWAKV